MVRSGFRFKGASGLHVPGDGCDRGAKTSVMCIHKSCCKFENRELATTTRTTSTMKLEQKERLQMEGGSHEVDLGFLLACRVFQPGKVTCSSGTVILYLWSPAKQRPTGATVLNLCHLVCSAQCHRHEYYPM